MQSVLVTNDFSALFMPHTLQCPAGNVTCNDAIHAATDIIQTGTWKSAIFTSEKESNSAF